MVSFRRQSQAMVLPHETSSVHRHLQRWHLRLLIQSSLLGRFVASPLILRPTENMTGLTRDILRRGTFGPNKVHKTINCLKGIINLKCERRFHYQFFTQEVNPRWGEISAIAVKIKRWSSESLKLKYERRGGKSTSSLNSICRHWTARYSYTDHLWGRFRLFFYPGYFEEPVGLQFNNSSTY